MARQAYEKERRTYVRVPHDATSTMAIKFLHDGAIVGAIASSELFLLTELALSTGNIEGGHDSISWGDSSHLAPDLLDNAHAFVTKDLALLELQDLAVVQVQIRSADCVEKEETGKGGRGGRDVVQC